MCKKPTGRRNHPYGPLFRAFYWAVAPAELPGPGKQGSEGVCEAKGVSGVKGVCGGKGVCRVCEGGEGFYSPGRGSHIREKMRAQRWLVSKGSVSAPDWTARASCRLLIGWLGCRAVSGACLQRPLLGHFPTCLTLPWPLILTLPWTFHPDLALTLHPGLFDIGQGAPTLSGYFLRNGVDEG